VDSEGLMEGIPLDIVRELRRATSKRLIVAGGINSQEQIDELDRMNVDAVVGMAIYTGRIRV
jgi:phosphoribosylformimino-5-aminoimidazole carboxamide ribonucleotide (ProFAR) isomerase